MAITKPKTQHPDQWLSRPTLDDVQEAAARLDGVATETPLLENPDLNSALGGRLLIKAETAQRTGSFKFRGAYNRISQFDEADRMRGAIAYSSGNHAQAVAAAAKMAGTSAVIVMPTDAPKNKMTRTREIGAEVITYERDVETREDVAERLGSERGFVMVPPNEDRRVMAGAGTTALELYEQARSKNAIPDVVMVPCGGGGLTAAVAIVFSVLSPRTDVYAVEPELFDDTLRSLESGTRLANPKGRRTICDSIMTDMPGALTFPINLELLRGAVSVSDDEVRHAMRSGFEDYKTVIEPGGAVGLAAVLSGKIDARGKTVAVIATGGNVDASNFLRCLGRLTRLRRLHGLEHRAVIAGRQAGMTFENAAKKPGIFVTHIASDVIERVCRRLQSSLGLLHPQLLDMIHQRRSGCRLETPFQRALGNTRRGDDPAPPDRVR